MFIKLLLRNLQMIFRTLKSVFLRPFVIIKYKISSMTNISKLLNKIPKFFVSLVAKLRVKPEKREDYVDAGSVFVAKSLLVILIIIIIGIPLLIYYFAWPWFVSLALTADFYAAQTELDTYSGKVRIYYEQEMENLQFEGRLKDGERIEHGKEYFLNGMLKYSGSFAQDEYDGKGTLYSEDGAQIYKGDFKNGKYDGTGELSVSEGTVYKGDFAGGIRSGKGQILEDGKLSYEGGMLDDKKAGVGKLYYPGGTVAYSGGFAEDNFEGDGIEYYESGNERFGGTFKAGLYSGKGVLYYQNGGKLYEGDFERGQFSGEGRYYGEDGALVYSGTFADGLYDAEGKLIYVRDSMWYEGAFMAGKASGDGKLFKNGALYYEGGFVDGCMSGTGTLTDTVSGLTYTGAFINDDIEYGSLFSMPVSDIYAAFPKGLEEDTSNENYFVLYNQGFGLVLKLAYATDTEPAKLTAVYKLPSRDGSAVRRDMKAPELPGTYEIGKTGEGRIDNAAVQYLKIEQGKLKYSQAIYDGYSIYLRTSPQTDEVLLTEYYPGPEQLNGAGGQGKTAVLGGEPAEYYAIYFDELGLDILDFSSLGFNQ